MYEKSDMYLNHNNLVVDSNICFFVLMLPFISTFISTILSDIDFQELQN
jgi:hypothetical protein